MSTNSALTIPPTIDHCMTTPATHPRHAHGAKGLWVRARFWMVTIGLGLVFAVALITLGAWWLARSAPSWWSTVHTLTPQSDTVGRELENAVVNQLHAQRTTPEAWSVAVSEHDANDWLATRLVKWLQNRDDSVDWSTTIERAAVSFKSGSIVLGVSIRTQSDEPGQVFTIAVVPSLDEEGRLWLPASELSIGQLPLPLDLITADENGLLRSLLPDAVNKGAGSILSALAGTQPIADEAILTLADKRRVRLTSLEVHDGSLELTCETAPAR
jgi:hypothetical protein